jgi:hypothetical protein
MTDFEVSISKILSVRGKDLSSNRKCFTYWHFKVCHALLLTESVLLIDTSKPR